MGGAGPIPFLSIDRYAARFGIRDGDDFERFFHLIKRMDAAFLEWVAERARDQQPEN